MAPDADNPTDLDYDLNIILISYDLFVIRPECNTPRGSPTMNQVARTPKQMGAIIRRARRKANLSQTELGHLTGLWQETISKIENGQSATKLATLLNLLGALDLEIQVAPRRKGSPADFDDIF